MPVFYRQLPLLVALVVGTLTPVRGTDTAAATQEIEPAIGTITSIREAFARWPELTDNHQSVRFEGVVTSTMPSGAFRMQDGENGIYVSKADALTRVAAGDRVIVTGFLRKGGFSPWMTPETIDRVGVSPFPRARAVDFRELAAGSADNQWVEIEGVVQAVHPAEAPEFTVLELGMAGGNLRVMVNFHAGEDATSLLDASVRIHGVAAVNVNAQHQVVEPSFRVPALSEITILQAGEKDPFAQPLTPADRLLGFATGAPRPQHRIRTSGVVTRQLSETMLFIRDREVGLKVELSEPQTFHPGDQLEVAGFPMIEDGMAVIEHSRVRRSGTTVAPTPGTPTLAELRAGKFNSDLVRTSARLVDWVRAGSSVTLVFQSGDQLFKGLLNLPASTALKLPERNSVVAVTGICVVSDLEDLWFYQPRSFLFLVADVAEVELLQAPPWWTPQRLAGALTIAIGVLLAVAAWVGLLRREITRTRSVIEQQARHAAALEERSRIARDLHDTLEQGLTGLSLQMKAMETDLADASTSARSRLQFARQMLKHSRALARNAIRELRSDLQPWQGESLADALKRIADTWNRSGAVHVSLRLASGVDLLPVPTADHVLGIATEAVTNAVKHGRATNVGIEIIMSAAELQLLVLDDGEGFDSAAQRERASGGYGLIGMQERAREIRAILTVQSAVGRGTCVRALLPLRTSSQTARLAKKFWTVAPSPNLPLASSLLSDAAGKERAYR